MHLVSTDNYSNEDILQRFRRPHEPADNVAIRLSIILMITATVARLPARLADFV